MKDVTSSTQRIMPLVLVIGLTLLPYEYCSAKPWWQIAGGILCTIGAILEPAAAVPLAAAQVTLLSGAMSTNSSGTRGSPPFIAEPENLSLCPKETDNCLAKTALLMANYVPLTLKTDDRQMNSLIVAANELSASVNSFTHAYQGEGTQSIGISLRKFTDKLSNVNEIIITQKDIDKFQNDTAIHGLPDFEVKILADAGLSVEAINSIAKALASMKFKLSVPSVTLRDALYDVSAAISTPTNISPLHAIYNPGTGTVYIPYLDVSGIFGDTLTYEVYLQQRESSFTFDLDLTRVKQLH